MAGADLSKRRRWWLLLGTIAAGLCVVWIVAEWVRRPPTEQQLDNADAAVSRGDFDTALRLADNYLEWKPKSIRALLIAGKASAALQRDEAAFNYFALVPHEAVTESAPALFFCGNQSLQSGRLSAAESYLKRALAADPQHVLANDNMLFLLHAEGRLWELMPYSLELMRAGHFIPSENSQSFARNVIDYIAPVGSTEWLWLSDQESQFLEFCRQAEPDDHIASLGLGRQALLQNDHTRAIEIFKTITAENPRSIEAQARLGEALVRSGSQREFLQWHRRLPAEAEVHPQIWTVRGLWAEEFDRPETAVRCYWEAIVRDPNQLTAHYRVSQLLATLNRPDEAQPFANRATRLADFEYLIKGVRNDPDKIRPLVDLLKSLGRYWEAVGWCHVIQQLDRNAVWAQETIDQLSVRLNLNTPLTDSDGQIARQVDLSHYALPDWTAITSKADAERSPVEYAGNALVSFLDEATAVGLNFTYYNGADSRAGRAYMFEFSGGGIAVLDYDGDAWPDLYFTQGASWPVRPEQQEYRDRLFRNLGNGRFEDVTNEARLGDNSFSGGIAVGDYDCDGFPDLYVANIGANRLYRNNGDGTFSDATDDSDTAGAEWTVSSIMADFNGDLLPDLYSVNYLKGDDVFERACSKNQRPVQCYPTDFAAEQDRLLINLGDGRFSDVTEQSGIVQAGGKGMGVVAADFDGSGRPSLFIANDTTANFFFVNRSVRKRDQAVENPTGKIAFRRPSLPSFDERALLNGLAVDVEGRAQSCMGIAAGDANGDGRLDLFVTNFIGEANNLYVQRSDGTFQDVSRQFGLRDSGYNRMGWGAQFLDGELDGLPDLVVANGNLDDYTPEGIPYGMRLLYYRNTGNGRFVTVPGKSIGPYFRLETVGRAVVRIDWNRDGLEDFCVTHVDKPAALLTNRTQQHGHFIVVKLRAVKAEAGAIGTLVRVRAGNKTFIRQLTAGDGFMASNQRQLIFGLGSSSRIEVLDISWNSGNQQQFKDLDTDTEYLFIEGRRQPLRLR